jgi:dihydrofolate synthase/folylpolyglutamate synthase
MYYLCKPNIPRGMDAEELKQNFKQLGFNAESYTSVNNAFQEALKNANAKDLIFN